MPMASDFMSPAKSDDYWEYADINRQRKRAMRFDREFDQSEKAGFAQDGILLSREPFSPQQIVELLEVLEEQEGLLTSPQP